MYQYVRNFGLHVARRMLESLEGRVTRIEKQLEALTGAPGNGMGDQDPADAAGVGSVNYTVSLSGSLVSGGTASGTIVDGSPDSGSVTVEDVRDRIPSGKQIQATAIVDVVKYGSIYQLTGWSCDNQEDEA